MLKQNKNHEQCTMMKKAIFLKEITVTEGMVVCRGYPKKYPSECSRDNKIFLEVNKRGTVKITERIW